MFLQNETEILIETIIGFKEKARARAAMKNSKMNENSSFYSQLQPNVFTTISDLLA